mmetsp:Transcript_23029/g.75059  ORF Transcript_23029/g.75059 Transcript_23029/m.75059 type:complete len:395 (-) Transcript_23029:67-1251(-)
MEDELGEGSYERRFLDFVTQRMQAWWRGVRQRRRYLAQKGACDTIQTEWRKYQTEKSKRPDPNVHAGRIQRAWRSYTSVRIYRYYRDLIRFRERGDPAVLLRSINPQEANLVDAATGLHVKFRLGGTTFPPLIFYKIFTHRPITDMCSFSPKDYTQERTIAPKLKHNNLEPGTMIDMGGGQWYMRVENNGWRPISDRVLVDVDPITQYTAAKRYTFHFDPGMRREEKIARRKQKQREWMMKLYKQGRASAAGADDDDGGESSSAAYTRPTTGTSVSTETDSHGLPMRPKGQTPFDEFDAEEAELEEMLEWTGNLDFDAYQSEWLHLATSSGSEAYMPLDQERWEEQQAFIATLAMSGSSRPGSRQAADGPFITSRGGHEIQVGGAGFDPGFDSR